MKHCHALPMLLTALLLTTKAFAYDNYDEDEPSIAEAFSLALLGGGFLLAGYLVGQVNFLAGLGRVMAIIGVIIGGCGVLYMAMMILSWAITTAFTLALYLGGLFVVGYILYAIYQWLFTPKH